ncbi:MAG TPA: DUF349 domain-containing protein [Candidatus Avibacteroides faecavium]|nr:DUF349 domain-containing protein [Candidatus Avibacteroides faecavium]
MESENLIEQPANEAPEKKVYTKPEIIARLDELSKDPEKAERQEVEGLKQSYYKLRKSEVEKEKAAFLEAGGDENEFKPSQDADEPEFKRLMSILKEERNKLNAELERQKEENLEKKTAIINRIKELTEAEDVNKAYNEFKQLRDEWNSIKLVPATKSNELWKNYQHYVEQFYDLLKINNELRSYDFKKNLELKQSLCEVAEKLTTENDVVSAFHQLQNLHQEYRETGPVAPELREEIWARFKAASTIINKRYQQHFEEIKEKEQKALDEKTVICEIVEAINAAEIKTYADWDAKTAEIIALQTKWKTIGFAPQKMNQKIYDRFREACNLFFKNKGDFYKGMKEQMAANLAKKVELCEKAESLKDSTDWKATSEALAELQKQWKEIGPVTRKQSEAVWKRFIDACDYFFEQRNKVNRSQKDIERTNLATKRSIIEEMRAIPEDTDPEVAIEQIKELQQRWNDTGHVPFKDKDKVYKEYREVADHWYDLLRKTVSDKRLSNFRANMAARSNDGTGGVHREKDRLLRQRDNMRNELNTYENNLNFLNFTSKDGSSLLAEINRKIDKLRDDIRLVEEKIKALDEMEAQQD